MENKHYTCWIQFHGIYYRHIVGHFHQAHIAKYERDVHLQSIEILDIFWKYYW